MQYEEKQLQIKLIAASLVTHQYQLPMRKELLCKRTSETNTPFMTIYG